MQAIPLYIKNSMRADLIAGLTVAVMGVPQAMAYAMIAELPPVLGLYTAIVSCAVAAILGSSRHLVTGPTNAVCMVLLSLVGPVSAGGGHDPIEVVLFLTFLTGLLQLAFGFLRLGGIIRYVSNSVVIGFTVGAGILIGANQLRNILGLDLSAYSTRRFHEVLIATTRELPSTNFLALIVGGLTMVVIVVLPRYSRRVPAGLLGVVAAGVLTALTGWSDDGMGAHRVETVRDIQPISSNLLAMFHLPEFVTRFDFSLASDLFAGAGALALIGFLEAASIARTIAAKTGQRLDFNQEFIGQGASKVVGAFCSCFAGSGSFTRSVVCFNAGGETRMAAVFSALWTALIVVLIAPLANHIPKAALAGLLLVVAASMIDRRRLAVTWRSGSSSRIVLSGTLAATLILPLQYAILIGVVLSVIMLLRVTGRMDLTHLVPHPVSGFEEVPYNRVVAAPVVMINLEGDLYFAAADDLDYELLRCLSSETKVVVLRMKRLRAAGSTAMAMLEHYEELLRSRGVQLVVCGVEEELERLITKSGFRARIGERNLFFADNHLLRSTELAHARAQSLVEAERRSRATATREQAAARAPRDITVGDLMSRRCIRFGKRHPLREVFWLMSELRKESTSQAPLPLFLQDREGRLFGELSVWRILAGATDGARHLGDLDDSMLRTQIRERFELPIAKLARTDLPPLTPESSLDDAVDAALKSKLPTLPVRDQHERLVGLVDAVDLLRGIARRNGIDCRGVSNEEEGGRTRIAASATAAVALDRFLLRPGERAPRTLVVVGDEDRYGGVITPISLLRELTAPGRSVEAVLEKSAAEISLKAVPTAPPAAPIAHLLDLLLRDDYEAVPVVVDERAVGLIAVVDVFRSIADLALDPEDRAIDTTRKG